MILCDLMMYMVGRVNSVCLMRSMIFIHLRAITGVVALYFISFNVFSAQPSYPEWWGNDLGKEEVVLPGYAPLRVDNTTILLSSGRQYKWEDSYLPVKLISKNQSLVSNAYIEVLINGKTAKIRPDNVEVVEANEHHVIIKSSGQINDTTELIVTTRVEYDGVAMAELLIKTTEPVDISQLHLVFEVQGNPWTKMLAFSPGEIGERTNRVVYEPEYSGEYLSALALSDGQKSFWLFQDNAEGWHTDGKDMLAVKPKGGVVEIRNKLINNILTVESRRIIKFNFLATPVKDVVANVKQNRVARNKSPKEGNNHGVHLWWINAFSHQLLPYTDYPLNAESGISDYDKKAYPGLFKNRRTLLEYKRSGIDRLPYFSAHVLNQHDPAYKKFRKQWEIHPVIHWNSLKYDPPFRDTRDETFLTHRAEGYTDYLLYRFSNLIDELGFEGLYFDQGGVRLSANPDNGQWIDSSGSKRGATDILAMREFHKRLATLFYTKEKKGLIVSHNSNDVIIPAYTFATSMVQGEEFNHWLTNYDYIDSVELDEVRTRLSGSAYGVPGVWLEVIFAVNKRLKKSNRPYNMSKSEWHKSVYYENAYKNFMALALLHDIPVWSYADLDLRVKTLKQLDWIEPETARFTGYWNYSPELFENQLYFSYYQGKDKGKYLIILSNLAGQDRVISYSKLLQTTGIGMMHESCADVDNQAVKDVTSAGSVQVISKRFTLLRFNCQ